MAKWVVTTGASKCAKRICTIRISERTDTTGAKGNEDIEKAEYLQATLRILVCSRTPPGNLGFSALQVNSLPSSSLPGARASLLTVELLLCVVDTFGSPITCPPSLQMILAAGELPQVSQRAAIGRPA